MVSSSVGHGDLFADDPLVDLLAMDRESLLGLKSEFHPTAFDVEHCDLQQHLARLTLHDDYTFPVLPRKH
jgi:hypothetical protein